MAWFAKKEWKNRLAEFAGRRTLTDVATGASQVVDVARSEGTISQEGDAFSAANMNEFEQRILEGFTQAENANTELNKNFQDGVNTIVSAVNTKAGTSLTGANTPAEIADVITNIETSDLQYGSMNMTANTSWINYDITFPKKFDSVPKVMAYCSHGGYNVATYIWNITQTGCRISLMSTNGATYQTTTQWCAFTK